VDEILSTLAPSAALVPAFERAAGRRAGIEPVARAAVAFARRVVEAGRRAFDLPACPAAVLRRAVEVFRPPGTRSAVAAVWRLLFDSWREPTTALSSVRGPGSPRFLRFGGRGGSLDVEMVTPRDAASDPVSLRGTVDGLAGPLLLEIAPRSGSRIRVPVRAGGAFAASLPAGASPFTLAVRPGSPGRAGRASRKTLFRTGRIPPPPRG
jgi:hypothetical protein